MSDHDLALDGWGEDFETARTVSSDLPITPLGQKDGVYSFISRSGERRHVEAGKLTPNIILSLFDGDPAWLIKNCGKRDREGNPVDDWAPKSAAAMLMRLCAAAGLYEKDNPIRGAGLWPHPAGPICHFGGYLVHWLDDGPRLMRAGQRIGGQVYPAFPMVARPTRHLATVEDGQILLRALRLWQFQSPVGADLTLGWIGAALMGGVASWHPHLMISAELGSGKTALCKLVGALFGVDPLTNFTEPGLRGMLTNEARGVVLDEAEGSARLDPAIELLRHMASETGASIARGAGDGTARRSSAVGSVMLAAINPPTLLPQDRSRIAELELNALPKGLGDEEAALAKAKVDAAHHWAEKAGGRFRSRAASLWRQYRASFAIWSAALLARGASPRQADQIGSLLAGRELLLSDRVSTIDEAKAGVKPFLWLLERMKADDADSSDALQCLRHLLSYQVEAWAGGVKLPLGEKVLLGLQEKDGSIEARRSLRAYGLRLEMPNGRGIDEPLLMVSNEHHGLSKVFTASRWQGGGWVRALRRLDGARAWSIPLQFMTVKTRATAIPGLLRYLNPADDLETGDEIATDASGDPLADPPGVPLGDPAARHDGGTAGGAGDHWRGMPYGFYEGGDDDWPT